MPETTTLKNDVFTVKMGLMKKQKVINEDCHTIYM